MLLELHVAEEDARYLSIHELEPAGAVSRTLTRRWLQALVAEGLVERKRDLVALSSNGHELVSAILEEVYRAQRALD